MKIGEFSKNSNIPIMTIRFYMEIGLLRPKKGKGLWNFSDESIEDIHRILCYKECGLSIDTIKNLFSLHRNPDLSDAERQLGCQEILLREKQRLIAEQQELEDIILHISESISAIDGNSMRITSNSIPFKLFSLIYCPYCNKPLDWEQVKIAGNAVISGSGHCECRYTADIEDGILISHNESDICIKIIDSNRQTIRKRTAKDVSCIEKYYLWLLDKLKHYEIQNCIVFEDVINTICFSSRAISELEADPYFILCDTEINVVKYYANSIRAMKPDCRLLMIVDDGIHHPLKKGCINVILDYCSSEIMQYYGFSSVFPVIRPYAHENALVLGRFSYIHKRLYPLSKTKPNYTYADKIRYDLSAFRQDMQDNGIKIQMEIIGTETLDESVYDGCLPGDTIRPYVFTGVWKSP